MAVQRQYNDNDYKNWLRACLGLKYLKEGIVDFVDSEVKQLHASILSKVCGAGPAGTSCNQCLTNTITDRRRPQPCPINICDKIRKEIENEHRYPRPCWENTDATRWCTDYWEIGKCFMSKGSATTSTAAETDCTGLLSVCINGMFLPTTLTGQIIHPSGLPGAPTDIFHKNRDARNALLHSASMSISDAERQDYIADMIKLLANYKTPVDHVTQNAIDNLNTVNSIDINIVPALEVSLLQTKLDALTMRQTQVEDQIQEQNTEHDQYKEHVQNNEAALLALRQRLDELQRDSGEDIAGIQKACTTLQDRTEQVHKRLLDMETKVKEIDDIKNKVEDHAFKIDTILRQEVDRKYEAGTKDVQDFLMAKYKRDTSDVPMSPILHTHCAHVDEIYTELIIRNDLVHKPKDETKSHALETFDPCRDVESGRRLDTTKAYEGVLFDGQTACKNIYVVGNAGIGKTTWSRKFVATWVKAIEKKFKLQDHSNIENKTDEEMLNENESILQEYDLVFYIALRHATADRHIMQMIEHQLFPYDPELLATVKALLKNPDTSSRCIIILDGLDEWCSAGDVVFGDGTPLSDPTWKCSTITTTRAWKLEELQLVGNKIDRAVEIQGLDRDGTNKLIDHVVSVLNKNTAKNRDASAFRSQISLSVQACMQVPLLLTILVCLWHDGIQINTHLAGTYSELIEMLIRCAQGDKRKRLFQKLSTEELHEMKRHWSSEKCLPPDCLSAKQLFAQYLPFLLRLGKLAFDMLFFKSMESTLVFDYDTIKAFLSENELELSVKIGILSQTTHPGSALKQKFCLSFLHKTVQEYLAALYMVSGDSQSKCVDKFKTYCKSSKDILEMENVLLFVSGLCPKMAGEISCYIADMEPNDGVHRLMLRCWRESQAVTTTQSQAVTTTQSQAVTTTQSQAVTTTQSQAVTTTQSQAVTTTQSQAVTTTQSQAVTTTQSQAVTTTQSQAVTTTQSQAVTTTQSQAVTTTQSSTGIYIKHHFLHPFSQQFYSSNKDTLCYLQEVKDQHTSLKITGKSDIRRSGHTVSTELLERLDLSKCQSLRALHCSATIPIVVPNSLETVKIYEYKGSKYSVLDFSECLSLRTLHCMNSEVQILVPNSLEEVTIVGYTASELALSGCQSLKKLYCKNSCVQMLVPNSLEEVTVDGYYNDRGTLEHRVLDLSGCRLLRNLHYKNSKGCVLVPDSLEEVNIDRCTGPTRMLSLSECHSLKRLHYTDSNIGILVPDSLEEVTINRITGSTGWWVLDLSKCQSLKKLHYTNSNEGKLVDICGGQSLRNRHCKRYDIQIVVPDSLEELTIDKCTGPTECLLDLSGCQSLRNLCYTDSNVRILVPDSLEEVDINKYKGPKESVLDMSGCQSLRKLQYTYSSVKIQIPNNLEEVTIKRYYMDSTECVLDMSRCQSLRKLNYRDSNVRLQVPDSLEEVAIDWYIGSTDWVLDMSRCQSLRKLHYSYSYVRIHLPNSLEEVDINSYTGPKESVFDLSGCLSLRNLQYTSSNLQILVPDTLVEVKICRYEGSPGSVLDFSGCQSLKKFYFTESNVRILVPDSLEEVTIDTDRYKESTEWTLNLSRCQSLKKLHYTHSNVCKLLDICGSQSLRNFHAEHSTVQTIVPDSLEELTINKYTGSTECLLDLSGCQSLRKLCYTDSNVRIRVPDSLEEVDINKYKGPKESVLDMSGCRSLRKLQYTSSNVRIQVPDSLQEVEIEWYIGSTEWVLDLSECQSLRKLHYTHSNVRILVPDSVEVVEIFWFTGSTDWVLDLSRCLSLKTFQYIVQKYLRVLLPDSVKEHLKIKKDWEESEVSSCFWSSSV